MAMHDPGPGQRHTNAVAETLKGFPRPLCPLDGANARDLTYSASVKAIYAFSAMCALCLPFAGCKSDAPKASDSAIADTPAERGAAQSDAASDGIAERADASPIPEDVSSRPEAANQDVPSDVVEDAASDSLAATYDLGKDASSDLGAPAVDLATDLQAAEVPVVDVASSEAGCAGWTALKRLSPAEVSDLLATSDPIVINVHIPYAGDIPGTDTSIPYNNVDAIEAYLNHDHCADVLLICLSGGMSQSAGNELVNRGYLRVRDMNGGMQAWQAAGYPLLKDGGN